MADDNQLDQVRERLALGQLSDVSFDTLLPPLTRARSSYTWTPVAVARRAALHFAERGASRVLDIGCGPGKFCIAAGLAQPELSFCGVDRSAGLTRIARELTAALRVPNVETRKGDALDAPWHDFDGFYFFNPFSDDSRTSGDKLLRVAELLREAPRKSVVVTYHGLGGPIPSNYDLVSEERLGSGPLRVWVKVRPRDAAWYHLDYSHGVSRVPRKFLERKLGALLSSDEAFSE
jgi:SAM-dependent methyltransferase